MQCVAVCERVIPPHLWEFSLFYRALFQKRPIKETNILPPDASPQPNSCYFNWILCTAPQHKLQHTDAVATHWCINLAEFSLFQLNFLQHTATRCNTLQHTATHCNTLQHTATHCNTLRWMHITIHPHHRRTSTYISTQVACACVHTHTDKHIHTHTHTHTHTHPLHIHTHTHTHAHAHTHTCTHAHWYTHTSLVSILVK